MKKELSLKQIYEDFINKVILTEQEKEVLDLYIRNYSILKISDITSQGTTTLSRIISYLKDKYKNYKKLEIERLKIFEREKV